MHSDKHNKIWGYKVGEIIPVVILMLVIFVMPFYAYAQGATGLQNPLGQNATVYSVLFQIIRFILGLVAFIAILILIWGGIKFMTATGNEERVRSAKSTIIWAIVGIVVILLSFVIIETVKLFLTP